MIALFSENFLVIDYGSTHMKGVLLSAGGLILETETLPIIPLSELVNAADIVPESQLGEYEYNITRFIQSFFPEEKNYVINIPTNQVYVRDVTIPITNLKQIQEILPFEVENQLPISLDEAEVIGHTWNLGAESSNVISFAASHESLESTVDPFLKGNTVIKMLSLDAVGLSGIVHRLNPEEYKDKVIGQLDIGGDYSILNILKDGELVFTRSLPFGGRHITEIVADVLGLEMHEAETHKQLLEIDITEGVNLMDHDESYFRQRKIEKKQLKRITLDTRQLFEDLAMEVERSILAADVDTPSLFYLSGGCTFIEGGADFIQSRLEKEVLPYPLELSNSENIAPWVTALGTAEHYRLKEEERIDFLNTPFGGTLRSGRFNFNVFATPVLFAIGAVIIFLVSFLLGIIQDRRDITFYKNQISKVAAKVPGLKLGGDPLLKARALCRRKLKSQNMEAGRVSVLDLLKDLSSNTPGESEMALKVRKFSYDGNKLIFRAIIDDLEKMSELEKKIKGSPYFDKVTTTTLGKALGGKIRVEFKMFLKEKRVRSGGKC